MRLLWRNLRLGKYRFLVWADYVVHGTKTDLYYNTSNFEEIILADRQNHTGSTDRRDAFRGEKDPVLVENRCIEIDPPDPKGGYAITVRHRFEARRDAVLDRTPPHGDVKKGKWGGGYAGATLRLDPAKASLEDIFLELAGGKEA